MSAVRFKPLVAAALSATLLTGVVVAPAPAGVPGSPSAINMDARGVALGGYDPVAYFDGGEPTPGVDTISASYEGARHLFAREAHRKTFLANPKKYIPEFGGFCAVGASFGEKADIDPKTGKVVNGKAICEQQRKGAEHLR